MTNIEPATDRQIELMKRFWEETPSEPAQRLLNAQLLKKDFLSLVARIEKSEAMWRPISEADKTIVDVMEFPDVGITIRNSAHILARDEDGRTYEAAWTDHKGGYWWDFDSESPVDPVEFKALTAAPASAAEPVKWLPADEAPRGVCALIKHQSGQIDVAYKTNNGEPFLETWRYAGTARFGEQAPWPDSYLPISVIGGDLK